MNPLVISLIVSIIVGAILLKILLPWIGKVTLKFSDTLWVAGCSTIFALLPSFIAGMIFADRTSLAALVSMIGLVIIEYSIITIFVIAKRQRIQRWRALVIALLMLASNYLIVSPISYWLESWL
jgi:hypothetical protein